MKKKFRLGKDAFILSVLTLITVLTWMAFDIYQALSKTEIPKILQQQIAPLNPKLSGESFADLESRIDYGPAELNEAITSILITNEEEIEKKDDSEEEKEIITTEGEEAATESGGLQPTQ